MATWTHRDPYWSLVVDQAIALARAGKLGDKTLFEPRKHVYALVSGLAYAGACANGTVRIDAEGGPPRLNLSIGGSPRLPRLWAAIQEMVRDLPASCGVALRPNPPALVTTWSQSETGALPLVAIVAISGVAATAIIALAWAVPELVERGLRQTESTKRLAAEAAALIEVAKNHAQREADAGKPLPLSVADVAVIERIDGARRAIISTAANSGTGSAAGIGIWLTVAAVAAAWWISRSKKE